MTLRVEFPAGPSFSDACRKAQKLMDLLPVLSSVSFMANSIECTVFKDTDPEEFEQAVNLAQDHNKTYVSGTTII